MMDAHFDEQDWTMLTVPSSYSSSGWDSSSSASSTPRLRPSARLSSDSSSSDSSTRRRPRLQRRHSPEATYLLSLVHQHEPIRVPVPPSLQAKGRKLSDRTTVSSYSPDAWYDYNEFGILDETATSRNSSTTSLNSTTTGSVNGRRSSSPMSSSSGRLGSRSSSIPALRKESQSPTLLGDAGVQTKSYGRPGTPPRPALVAKSLNNFPPPLSLPSPVIMSRLSQ